MWGGHENLHKLLPRDSYVFVSVSWSATSAVQVWWGWGIKTTPEGSRWFGWIQHINIITSLGCSVLWWLDMILVMCAPPVGVTIGALHVYGWTLTQTSVTLVFESRRSHPLPKHIRLVSWLHRLWLNRRAASNTKSRPSAETDGDERLGVCVKDKKMDRWCKKKQTGRRR